MRGDYFGGDIKLAAFSKIIRNFVPLPFVVSL